MLLENGLDVVRAPQSAEACEVSEKPSSTIPH